MKCNVCGENTQEPFIIYDCDKYICSWICTNRNPEGTITFDRIVNIKDFSDPIPVMPKKFEIKSDREIMAMTNINRVKYERDFAVQMKKDPVKTIETVNLVNMYSDSESDYSDEESDGYSYDSE
jgi:hypothetical protein